MSASCSLRLRFRQHSRAPMLLSLQVFMLSAEDHLDEEMLETIVNAEHTRVPVYEGERCGLTLHGITMSIGSILTLNPQPDPYT